MRRDPCKLERALERARLAGTSLVQTLEADCPWPFKGAKRRGGAGRHYKLLTMDEIKAYPLPPLAKHCRLLLWRVGAMQQEALDVGKAWGFTHKSEFVWIKTTTDGKLIIDVDGIGNDEVLKKPDLANHGLVHHDRLANLEYGCGHQTRYAHEVCLIFTRGNPERTAHFRSVFFAPIGKHSEKPDKFYQIAESMSPGPRYSLFSRKPRKGWMVDGDELAETG